MTAAPSPVLTIAIPTFNRAGYLRLNLERLVDEMKTVAPGEVEILVSDNHSTDATPQVVSDVIAAGLPVRYIRNFVDVGSDANIAQCFNEAAGNYVQIMGDDDMYVRGALKRAVDILRPGRLGILCIRPFGYEHDPEQEFPGAGGALRTYTDVGQFLGKIGPLITFISAIFINRTVQQEVDARAFCGSNLVQVHLVIAAALRGQTNGFHSEYMLACKRNNSGGYDFSEVFVERIGRILDGFRSEGLRDADIRRFETHMLRSYHPFYLYRQRLAKQGDLRSTYRRFQTRFGNRMLFRLWVAPTITLPRPIALAWGAFTTLVGRLLNGDLRRGAHFLRNRVLRKSN